MNTPEQIAEKAAGDMYFPNEQCRGCFCDECQKARKEIILAAINEATEELRREIVCLEKNLADAQSDNEQECMEVERLMEILDTKDKEIEALATTSKAVIAGLEKEIRELKLQIKLLNDQPKESAK